MSFTQKLKISRFVVSCVFLTGYTAYTAYAVYYYRTFGNALSIALLVLIGVAFGLSAFITFTSYRINLKDRPRPLALRFIKMTKYFIQLVTSAISLALVLSAVHEPSLFSLIIAAISIPFLLWGLLVNVLAEFIDHIFAKGFGRRVFIPSVPTDASGQPIDLTAAIRKVDGAARYRKWMEQKNLNKKMSSKNFY